MTRNEVLLMLGEGGLREMFLDADKSHEIIHGKKPSAYAVPNWLYQVLEQLQDAKPMWVGRKLDPWNKDEIRGQ